MERRTFITVIAGGLLAAPLAAEGQQAGKVFRIGVLSPAPPPSPSDPVVSPLQATFREGLAESGWLEGQGLVIEYRFAYGRPERLPELAAELLGLRVDVILAVTTPATQAASKATRTIPIVFTAVSDPVAMGFVTSLARPGGNVTGLTNISPELSGKLLELLKEAVPSASRVAVLWNPSNPAQALEFQELQRAAPTLAVTLQWLEVRGPSDFNSAFSAMTAKRPDAFITIAGELAFAPRQQIADFAMQNRLPTMFNFTPHVQAGGLMSYAPSYSAMFRRAGVLVGKILKGAKPADLPVEQPTKFDLVINLKTAKALGLTIPPSLLLRADEVIQ